MAIQEKLRGVATEVRSAGFGVANVDASVEVTRAEINKSKGSVADVKDVQKVIVLDVMNILSTRKGLAGLSHSLEKLAEQYGDGKISGQSDKLVVDVLLTELERETQKFRSVLSSDQVMLREVGHLISNGHWKEAVVMVDACVDDAKKEKQITDGEVKLLKDSLQVVSSKDKKRNMQAAKNLEGLSKSVHEVELGEYVNATEQLETKVVRQYLALSKKEDKNDGGSIITLDKKIVVDKEGVEKFVKDINNKSDEVSKPDARRLSAFTSMIGGNWNELQSGGIDLIAIVGQDDDKQRIVREAYAVASHVMYLDGSGGITLDDWQREYIKEVQRASSAVQRSWIEDRLQSDGDLIVGGRLTPNELREVELLKAGLGNIAEMNGVNGYLEWSKRVRQEEESAKWTNPDEFAQEGDGVVGRLSELSRGVNKKIEMRGGQVVWLGTSEEFFDEVSGLAREVSAIVPEVNQIPFSRSPKARLYQMLMESEADPGHREDLGWAKDAVFRLYTAGYVKEALWKRGGDIESFTGAGLALLGQGGDDSVYSSLFHFHESVRARGTKGEYGQEVIRIDLRDMLDYSESYSRIKGGKRSWLNAISSGDLNENGDATSLKPRKEFFYDYIKSVLSDQLDIGKITQEQYRSKLGEIGAGVGDEKFERIFDVYGSGYTNLVKVIQALHLRYGEVAVNQSLEPGTFDFCSPPGGEAVYKYHKNTVFKFVARYVPTNKFAEFLDGKIDTGMVSLPAFARKETLPHFILEHSTTGANPGADEYFFGNVGNDINKKKFAKQWVEFWKPAIFDSDNNPGKEYRDTDEMRMVADTVEVALGQMHQWPARKLEFVNNIDYRMLSKASGYDFERIFQSKGIVDASDKFAYVIGKWGHKFIEWNGMRSKRVAEFFPKYLKTNYAGVYSGAIKLSMNPTNDEYTFDVAKNIDAFSGAGKFIEDVDEVVEGLNKRRWAGVTRPKTKGGKGWLGVDEKGERAKIDLNGEFESSFKSLVPGSLDRTSLLGYGIGYRDPIWMKPFLWEAAYKGGQMSPEVFERRMRDYKQEMYLGPKFGRDSKLRWGHIPLLTPLFLMRGWFVDKWHLDVDDFWWITQKTNEKAWEEIKKALGIKI